MPYSKCIVVGSPRGLIVAVSVRLRRAGRDQLTDRQRRRRRGRAVGVAVAVVVAVARRRRRCRRGGCRRRRRRPAGRRTVGRGVDGRVRGRVDGGRQAVRAAGRIRDVVERRPRGRRPAAAASAEKNRKHWTWTCAESKQLPTWSLVVRFRSGTASSGVTSVPAGKSIVIVEPARSGQAAGCRRRQRHRVGRPPRRPVVRELDEGALHRVVGDDVVAAGDDLGVGGGVHRDGPPGAGAGFDDAVDGHRDRVAGGDRLAAEQPAASRPGRPGSRTRRRRPR